MTYICYYCERFLEKSQVTKDHVIPVSLGGAKDLTNIVYCCYKCNNFKGNDNLIAYRYKLETILKNINKLIITKNK